MAEQLAKKMLRDLGEEEFAVRSAGTLNIQGHPASPEAIAVLRDEGLDLREHRSQGLNSELFGWADIVIVMEPSHERAVLARSTAEKVSIVRLWEYHTETELSKIHDPIGRPLDAYLECRDILKNCLWEFLSKHLYRKRS